MLVHLLLVFSFIFFSPSIVKADTHVAASCSNSHVTTAIGLASNGDTVTIPAGTCQWDTRITMDKEITIQGAGIDVTIIEQDGFTVSSGTDNWRVTGITWDGEATSSKVFQITNSKNWRIDNVKIDDYSSRIIDFDGYCYGLVDNSQFIDLAFEAILYEGDGATAFERSDDFTSTDASDRYTNGTIYIEDSVFTQTYRTDCQIMDANEGARYVFRYNAINNNVNNGFTAPLDMHGYCETGQPTSSVSYEIYNNTITDNVGNWGSSTGFILRAGYNTIHDNIVPATWNNLVKISQQRSQDGAGDTLCTDKLRCGILGDCTNGTDNPSSPYCDYQIHDSYWWGNTKTGTGAYNSAQKNNSSGCVNTHLVEGTNYHDNTEFPSYVEYTYPHPLQDAGNTPPVTSARNPGKSAVEVAVDDDVEFTIADPLEGVDIATLFVGCEGAKHCCIGEVCGGGTADLTCTGTSASYAVTLDNADCGGEWSTSQVINITIDADDLAVTPNSMTQDVYSFTTTTAPPTYNGGVSSGGNGSITSGGNGSLTK